MTKREAEELAEVTRRIVARWATMTEAERTLRLQAAGILDATGEFAERYRNGPSEAEPKAAYTAPR